MKSNDEIFSVSLTMMFIIHILRFAEDSARKTSVIDVYLDVERQLYTLANAMNFNGHHNRIDPVQNQCGYFLIIYRNSIRLLFIRKVEQFHHSLSNDGIVCSI